MRRIIAVLLLMLASAVGAEPVQLADDAPDSYTVKRGDTLWAISGRFLKQPWRWPEVWRLNREQIRNPHLIYPGQVVLLDRNGPSLSLGRRIGGGNEGGVVKLSPQIHSEPSDDPIASVPLQAIKPFLTEALVIDNDSLQEAATVVATQEDRVLATASDVIFAKDIKPGTRDWTIYRRPKPIRDPATGEVLGYEAEHVGSARVTEETTPTTLVLRSASRDVNVGDRLIPSVPIEVPSFAPHAAPAELVGSLVGVQGGLGDAGRYNVVLIGLGARNGVEPGHVFALYRNRGSAVYRDDGREEKFQLPDQRFGLVFVFRVFDRVSYALVVDSDGPARVADILRAP